MESNFSTGDPPCGLFTNASSVCRDEYGPLVWKLTIRLGDGEVVVDRGVLAREDHREEGVVDEENTDPSRDDGHVGTGGDWRSGCGISIAGDTPCT